MEKRGYVTAAGVILTLLISVALVHTVMHFAVYGTGLAGYGERGISGLSIGGLSAAEISAGYPSLSPLSRKILLVEWIVLALATLATLGGFLVEHVKNKKETEEVVHMSAKGKSRTDLDLLYDVLKDKKHLKISTIAKMFNITDATATEWAKIFESGNLAVLNYPRIGEPEVIINN